MIERIIKIREREGLNQEKFAERLGLSRNFINQVENGKKKFSDRTLSDICREFNVNEAWLKTGEGEPFIKHSFVSLDDFAKTHNATEADYQLLRNYLSLDPAVRQQIQSLFSSKE